MSKNVNVRVTLFKDEPGNYAISVFPQVITLGDKFQESDDDPETDMTLTWILQEHLDNPAPPNAKKLTIKFGSDSPFTNESATEYVATVGTDGARFETAAIRVGAVAQDFRLYKYDIEILAKGTELDENGEFKDVTVKLDPHIRARRRTVRPNDLMGL